MLNVKLMFWFIILLVIPVSFTSYLFHERNNDIAKLHVVNLSFKGAPVLSINENTFKNQMDEMDEFKLVDKITTLKKNADDLNKNIKEKTEGNTNPEVREFKNGISYYDDFINNMYKQMQVGNFMNLSDLEKVEKIYDMDISKADSLIPMDASTIMWYVFFYYVSVLLLTVLFCYPSGFLELFVDIFLLGFLFNN